jgi:hypothetical protein
MSTRTRPGQAVADRRQRVSKIPTVERAETMLAHPHHSRAKPATVSARLEMPLDKMLHRAPRSIVWFGPGGASDPFAWTLER